MSFRTFRDLMRLAHGFEMAKAFLTANDLDLFSHLTEDRAAEELASRLGVDERALSLLLNALTAMGLIEKKGENYYNGPLVGELLVEGEDYRGNIFKHIHHCWGAWNALPEVIAQGHPTAVREEKILGGEQEWTRTFIRGMDDVTRELAPQVVSQIDFPEARVLLDVGGGPGTYAAAFLETCPSLEQVRIFDLPGALDVARERLGRRGLIDRVQLVQGDLHRDDFGGGVDVVWVSQLLHSLGENDSRMVVDKAFRALNPGGTLAVHEFLLDDDKAGPLGPALFGLHMLVMTAQGRSYSGGEVSDWMRQCGFVDVSVVKVSDDTGVVRGRKP